MDDIGSHYEHLLKNACDGRPTSQTFPAHWRLGERIVWKVGEVRAVLVDPAFARLP